MAQGLLGSLIKKLRGQEQLRVNLPRPLTGMLERGRRKPETGVKFGERTAKVGQALADVGRGIARFGTQSKGARFQAQVQPKRQALTAFGSQLLGQQAEDIGLTTKRLATSKGRKLLAAGARQAPLQLRQGQFGSFLENPAIVAGLAIPDIQDITRQGLRVAGKRSVKLGAKSTIPKALSAGEEVLSNLGKQFDQARTLRKQAAKGPGLLRSFRKNFLDRFSEVERVDETFFKDLRLLSGGGSGRVEQIVSDGTMPILQRESGRLEDFSKFLGLQRMNELVNVRGFERQLDSKGIASGLEALESKLGPEAIQQMSESGKQLRGFLNKTLDMYEQSGMITKKVAASAKSSNQQYITFESIGQMLREVGEEGYAKQSFNVAKQSAVKAIGSSKSGIADPLESTFQKLFHQIEIADRNSVLNDFVTRRPDLVSKVKEGAFVGADKGVINMFENGKKVSFAVDKEIADAVKNVDAQALPKYLRFLTIPTQIIKKGAVEFNPAFTLGVNPVRDLQDALVSTGVEKGGKEALGLLSSYGDSLSKAFNLGDEYAQWRKSGGAFGGFLGAEVRQAPETAIKRTAQRGQKFLATAKTPGGLLNIFKRASTAVEEAPRLARFKQEGGQVAEAGLAPFGKLPKELKEAAFQSRTGTLDFARAGNVSRFVNQLIPFFNVGIQGTARMASLAKDNPSRFIRTIGVGVGLPAATVYMNNRKFNDFKDVQDFEKENNMIVMIRDRTPEEVEQGKPIQAVKIPLGNVIKPFYNTIESFFDHVSGTNPQRLDQLGLDVLEDLSPVGVPVGEDRFRRFAGNVTPQASLPIVEQAANVNLFTGAPIVPQKLEGVEPSEQFNEKTGAIPKLLGKVTGTSPVRIQALASQIGGTVGRAIFQPKQGIPSATTGRFFGPRGGAESGREFEDIEKVERQAETVKIREVRKAESIFKEIKGNPVKAKARLLEIAKENPDLADRVLDMAEEAAKGLTSVEKRLGRLGVANQARAQVISNQLSKLKTNAEKKALLLDLSKKRILTDEVLDQVLNLVETGDKQSAAPRVQQARFPDVGEALQGVGETLSKANPFNPPEALAAEGEESRIEVKGETLNFENIGEAISEGFGRFARGVGEGVSKSVARLFGAKDGETPESIPTPEPGGPDDPFVKKGWVLDSDGRYRRPEQSIDRKTENKDLSGFRTDRNQPNKTMKSKILETGDKHDVDPHLISGILHQESGFVPGLTNENKDNDSKIKSTDRGIAQINDVAFPKISTDQANDNDFAIDFVGQRLAYLIDAFDGDIKKAILAYNRGEAGVREGRPDVNDYVNGVLANLTPEYRKQVGLLD